MEIPQQSAAGQARPNGNRELHSQSQSGDPPGPELTLPLSCPSFSTWRLRVEVRLGPHPSQDVLNVQRHLQLPRAASGAVQGCPLLADGGDRPGGASISNPPIRGWRETRSITPASRSSTAVGIWAGAGAPCGHP